MTLNTSKKSPVKRATSKADKTVSKAKPASSKTKGEKEIEATETEKAVKTIPAKALTKTVTTTAPVKEAKLEPSKAAAVETPKSQPHVATPTPAPAASVPAQKATETKPVTTQSATAPSPAATPSPSAAHAPVGDDKVIHFKPPIIVKDLAAKMSVKPFQLISDLMQLKILVSINQPVEPEIARKICEKHGFKLELERRGEHPPKPVEAPKVEVKPQPEKQKKLNLVARAPIVTIMGHVDHGKTSLLDAIRKTNVVGGEAGGITQHIGAYSVAVPSVEKGGAPRFITFLDTPGHEAFTAMRARGANITDIVILVVAGNEGLMPQTIEAMNHAKAAGVSIIVALTKMDLDVAQKMKDRVKKQLQEHDLAAEDWGGKTITVEVSATKKIGLEQLLEMILLQADVMELKAEPDGPATGNVIEAQMEAGRGATATVLVRQGTLAVGNAIIVGSHFGKIKALIDDKGKMIKEAKPSTPVKIVGLSAVPAAGASFEVVKSETEARSHSDTQQESIRAQKLEGPKRITLEDLLTASTDNRKTLKVILKVDVQGSLEAIIQSISKLPQEKINIDVIHSGVGPITESDVLLATASKALILGFQVKVETTAAESAKLNQVQIQLFRIIYELFDKLREYMAGLLDPESKIMSLGQAEVKQVFKISKGGTVAGCLVNQGRIERKGRARVVRRRNTIFEGGISTLRRFQDDVSEVRTGLECGIRLDGFNEFEPGDVIEVYQIEKIPQKL
jgi:translation initiation factor IF-2